MTLVSHVCVCAIAQRMPVRSCRLCCTVLTPQRTATAVTATPAATAGASIDDADEEGVTALINASESGSLESVRFLLDQKADASHVSGQGFTALVVAAAGGHVPVAKLLVAAGADVDHMEGEGVSALMYAAAGGHKEMVEVSSISMQLCQYFTFRVGLYYPIVSIVVAVVSADTGSSDNSDRSS
jgi:Ankyrin repeats (3 copies)